MNTPDKNSGFKIPEDYFEEFSEKLTDRLAEEDSVIPQKEGFGIPENYFDGIHEKIQEKLTDEETKVITLHPYRKYYYAVASAAAVGLVIFGLVWNTSEEITFDDLADSEIEGYFENNDMGLTSYEIAELIPVDELEINDILTDRLDEDNVLEYLNDNTDDFEELNLEYDE